LAGACGPAPGMFSDDPLFDPGWILEVRLELDPADWDALRFQGRSFEDLIGANCLEKPFSDPFTYFPAEAIIDGMRVSNVGVRKKCFFGSCDEERPALKISFNKFVRGQRFFGLRRLTLNNCKQDPSKIRQCLGYWLFRRAGLPAPRCNFAHVIVNGKDLGIYAHIESIGLEFLARNFYASGGNLYEGSLSDFRPEWVGTFQKKTNLESPDRSDLQALVQACALNDEEFLPALERLVDVEQFYSFWAMEVITGHWDGYAGNTNNFYLYRHPADGRFRFIPWGNDGTLALIGPPEESINMVMAQGILANRLYRLPETRKIYVERLEHLLDEIWRVEDILTQIDGMEQLISPYADSYHTGELAAHINGVRDFVRLNPEAVRAEIASGPPDWNQPLREPICFEQIGSARATFETTWESIRSPDPFSPGRGTLEVTANGQNYQFAAVAAVAGIDPNPQASPAEPLVQIIGVVPGPPNDTLLLVQVVIHDPRLITSGGRVPLDVEKAFGIVFHYDPASNPGRVVGLLLLGELNFTQASLQPGAALSGELSSPITESAW